MCMHHYLGLLNINLQIVYRQSSSNKALRWAESEILAGFGRLVWEFMNCFCFVNFQFFEIKILCWPKCACCAL